MAEPLRKNSDRSSASQFGGGGYERLDVAGHLRWIIRGPVDRYRTRSLQEPRGFSIVKEGRFGEEPDRTACHSYDQHGVNEPMLVVRNKDHRTGPPHRLALIADGIAHGHDSPSDAGRRGEQPGLSDVPHCLICLVCRPLALSHVDGYQQEGADHEKDDHGKDGIAA